MNEIPFLLEDRIVSLGGNYVKADNWAVSATSCSIFSAVRISRRTVQAKVVVDGNLITGQNPASASPIGKAILEALQK